jgi:hypothetical protein
MRLNREICRKCPRHAYKHWNDIEDGVGEGEVCMVRKHEFYTLDRLEKPGTYGHVCDYELEQLVDAE